MNEQDEKDLERFRARSKRVSNYINNYAKENYKRLVCLLPIEKSKLVKKAIGKDSISTYLNRLIDRDLKERGLI